MPQMVNAPVHPQHYRILPSLDKFNRHNNVSTSTVGWDVATWLKLSNKWIISSNEMLITLERKLITSKETTPRSIKSYRGHYMLIKFFTIMTFAITVHFELELVHLASKTTISIAGSPNHSHTFSRERWFYRSMRYGASPSTLWNEPHYFSSFATCNLWGDYEIPL